MYTETTTWREFASDGSIGTGHFGARQAPQGADWPNPDPLQTFPATSSSAYRCPEPDLRGAPERCCAVRINLSAQGGANPLLLKTPRLSGEARNWVKPLAASRSAALVAAPAVQVECSGSCNSGGKGPTNS